MLRGIPAPRLLDWLREVRMRGTAQLPGVSVVKSVAEGSRPLELTADAAIIWQNITQQKFQGETRSNGRTVVGLAIPFGKDDEKIFVGSDPNQLKLDGTATVCGKIPCS